MVDTDPGIDDALALMYLATCLDQWEWKAVTVVAGNVSLDQCVDNALSLVTLLGLEHDLPVHAGCARPLLGRPRTAESVHGADGLGGVERPRPAVAARPEHAVDTILRLSRAHDGELELLTLGPLTNLASALVIDPGLARRVRHLTFMGGAVHHRGNITPRAEFNVWADPEALQVVLRSGIPYTMIGLDATEQALLTRAELDLLGDATPVARLARAMLAPYVDAYEASRGLAGCALHDPLAAAAATDRGWVTLIPGRVAVETGSDLTRGETVFFPDAHFWQPEGEAAASTHGQVALELARPGFARHLVERLTAHAVAAAS